MVDLVLHLWLTFQRNTKQTHDCPGFPLSQVSLGYTQDCEVNCQCIIPLSSSLCNVMYTQKRYCQRLCRQGQQHSCHGVIDILSLLILIYINDLTVQPIQKEYISPPHASTLSDIILDGIHTNFKVTFPVSGFKSPFG